MKDSMRTYYMYLFLFLMAAAIFIPLYVSVMGGFKTVGELRTNALGLPSNWNFDNYLSVLLNSKFWLYLWNSVIYAIGTTFFVLLFASMTAFVFAHVKFAGNRFLYNYFLLGLLFPFATAILPLFLRVRDFGLLGTSWAVILPQIAFGLGFAIILFRGFFKQMPSELFDAAFVDGCTYAQFYFRFTLPLSTPILATVSVITLTGSWNNYLLPLIMINDESLYSWPMGIMVFRSEYFTDWSKVLAYVSLTLVPAIIFFLVLQKYIIAGLTGGTVKG
ncbi:MAG: thiamine ABC transporter ATP-binding protein [Bacteroidetes bacterium]|nr:thiamine ABC transporter ATP-binding protein [Bacteroidota bacterium]